MTNAFARRPRRPLLVTGALAILLAGGYSACADSTSPKGRVVSGTTASFAGGTGHTFVTLGADSLPTEVGVRFSENVLATLPAGTAMVDYPFELPAEASGTPYKQVVIGWNPTGHPPTVYLAPHFDVHFYQVTNAERDLMQPAADPNYATKLVAQPGATEVPFGYVITPGGVPRMGAHWVDTAAPEQTGQPFTSTFIYGSYNAAFIFGEPMIATAFLATHPTLTSPLKLPSHYSKPGRYPTTYSIAYDNATKEYVVSLGGFVAR